MWRRDVARDFDAALDHILLIGTELAMQRLRADLLHDALRDLLAARTKRDWLAARDHARSLMEGPL